MWARLIEEVLKLKLDEKFIEYTLIHEVHFVRELIAKLATK